MTQVHMLRSTSGHHPEIFIFLTSLDAADAHAPAILFGIQSWNNGPLLLNKQSALVITPPQNRSSGQTRSRASATMGHQRRTLCCYAFLLPTLLVLAQAQALFPDETNANDRYAAPISVSSTPGCSTSNRNASHLYQQEPLERWCHRSSFRPRCSQHSQPGHGFLGEQLAVTHRN